MRRFSRQGPLFIALFERLLSVAMVKGGVVINKASKQTTRFTINQVGVRREFEVTRNKEKTGIGREREEGGKKPGGLLGFILFARLSQQRGEWRGNIK
mmetsp:Transcript_6948/g.12886  ORF Transcript_6948/g.12886 Transcript_6948/m.12886 type:complete len:98 (+) Transcript_6948:712-1005(+)